MNEAASGPTRVSRRDFVRRATLVGLVAPAFGVLDACSSAPGAEPDPQPPPRSPGSTPPAIDLILPADPEVDAAERRRRTADGAVQSYAMTARPVTLDLAGTPATTWAYDDVLPGPLLRARRGDVLEVLVRNTLPEPTSVHWHGIALRNDMDGVHDVTQAPIRPGELFTYRFTVPDAGTHWYHSHHGLQADRGLYGPLIVDDPDEPGRYDSEHVIVLDDWIDGLGASPDEVRRALHGPDDVAHDAHGSVPGTRAAPDPGAGAAFVGRFRSDVLGGDAGSIRYPMHLCNGRPDRPTLPIAAGGRVRLRIINAGAETAYRIAVGGHRLTVTHSDGFPVEPVEVDAVLIGMGERYDVEVTLRDGAWPFVALAEGKDASTGAVLRTAAAPATTTASPPPDARPAELDGRLLRYEDLRAVPAARFEHFTPDLTQETTLTGRNADYHWGIDGEAFPTNGSIDVHQGQRLRLTMRNTTKMWHPMHLHGHSFRLGDRVDGPRKDTVIVRPGESLTFDTVCDNPGQWMAHCHNGYHQDAGMAIALRYLR